MEVHLITFFYETDSKAHPIWLSGGNTTHFMIVTVTPHRKLAMLGRGFNFIYHIIFLQSLWTSHITLFKEKISLPTSYRLIYHTQFILTAGMHLGYTCLQTSYLCIEVEQLFSLRYDSWLPSRRAINPANIQSYSSRYMQYSIMQHSHSGHYAKSVTKAVW